MITSHTLPTIQSRASCRSFDLTWHHTSEKKSKVIAVWTCTDANSNCPSPVALRAIERSVADEALGALAAIGHRGKLRTHCPWSRARIGDRLSARPSHAGDAVCKHDQDGHVFAVRAVCCNISPDVYGMLANGLQYAALKRLLLRSRSSNEISMGLSWDLVRVPTRRTCQAMMSSHSTSPLDQLRPPKLYKSQTLPPT